MEGSARGLTLAEGLLAERLARRGYEVCEMLARPGRFAKFRVRGMGGTQSVAKAVSLHSMSPGDEEALLADLRCLERVPEHPNATKRSAAFIDGPAGGSVSTLFLLSPFAADGDLGDLMAGASRAQEPLPLPVVREWGRQLLQGLGHLHQHGVVHRGVMPSNALLCGGRRLIRLGAPELPTLLPLRVRERGLDLTRNAYLAPELMQSQPYGVSVDIWALGCIFFELCTLALPFSGNSLLELPLQVLHGEPRWAAWKRADADNLKEAVGRMLLRDPAQRHAAAELLRAPAFADGLCEAPSDQVWASLGYFLPAVVERREARPAREAPAGAGLPNLLSSAPHARGDAGGGKAARSQSPRLRSKVQQAVAARPTLLRQARGRSPA